MPGVGISAVLQTDQLDLLVPVWTSESFVVRPSISFAHVSDFATEFGIGMGFRGNLRKDDAVPYLGAQVVILVLSPDNGDSITDLLFGPFFGGEYFFSNHLSVSVEAQINIAKSDQNSNRFGNPDGTNVNTATVALVSFYF